MAVSLLAIYAVLIVGLTVIAIYVQITASSLSLPLPAGATVPTIFLPLLSAANLLYYPVLEAQLLLLKTTNPRNNTANPSSSRSRSRPSRLLPRRLRLLLPPALQAAQAALVVVLAVLTAQGFFAGDQQRCAATEAWQRLWSARDGGPALARIQGALACCGLNSVRHEAWPDADTCAAALLRRGQQQQPLVPCRGPWTRAARRGAAMDFGVVVVVGVVQAIQLVYLRLGGAGQAWYSYNHPTHGGDPAREERLIEQEGGGEDDAGEAGRRRRQQPSGGYRDDVVDDDDSASDNNGNGNGNGSGNSRRREEAGYYGGSLEERGWGRMEPSSLA